MNKLSDWLHDNWRELLVLLAIAGAMSFILTFRLSTLTPGMSQNEVSYATQTRSLKAILKNPINITHQLTQYASHKLGHHGRTAMRLVSVLYGFLSIGLLYILVRKWHTRRIALMAATLILTSSWFLVVARSATDLVMLVAAPLLLLLVVYWLAGKKTVKTTPKVILSGLIIDLLLFTPFMIWMLAIVYVLYGKNMYKTWSKLTTKWRITAAGLWILGIVPFLYTVVTNNDFFRSIIGIPSNLPTVAHYSKSVVKVLWGLFVQSTPQAELHLGKLPLLDATTITMVVFGAYFYLFLHPKLRRTYALLASGVLLLLVSTFSDRFGASTILLPFVFIGVSAGLTILLGQWFTVFPRNPLARSVGVSIVVALVSLTALYHLQRYFIAWRYAPETKAVYSTILK